MKQRISQPLRIVSSSNHDHSHHSHHEASYNQPHPHADLPGNDNILERRALRTQKIADFLQLHFGEVETVETRPDEEGKVILDPGIIVRLDEWEARIGLLDLVRAHHIPDRFSLIPQFFNIVGCHKLEPRS